MATPTKSRAIVSLPLSDLQFDPNNPRLPTTVDKADTQAVLRWMLRDATLVELMGSIGEQGYFPGEPVLVTAADRKGHAPYIVVEGNRRLAASMLLQDPSLAPVRAATVKTIVKEAIHRPTSLPAVVFESRNDILDYLGYRHVTGVKQWDSLAKARYLKQLAERADAKGDRPTLQKLAKMIGSRADYVRNLLRSLAVYEHVVERDFYGLRGIDESDISFSLLTTALSYENIAEWTGVRVDDTGTLSLSDDNMRAFVDWTFRETSSGKTVVGESRNLRLLAAVVAEPRAISALASGVPLADAALLTDEPIIGFRAVVSDATEKVRLGRDISHRLPAVHVTDVEATNDLQLMARDLYRLVRARLEDQDETD